MISHKDLAAGRWCELSLVEQLANVGSDVERAIKWRKKGDTQLCQGAFHRALELIDLTVRDPKNKGRGSIREILRVREALVDDFAGNNMYGSTDEWWHNYFFNFAYMAALQRGR